MNSKKVSTVFTFVIAFLLMQYNTCAQTFEYTSPYFNISLPSLSIKNPYQTSPLPYYTLFIETGDGRYIKDINHILSADPASPYQIHYNFAIPAGSPAILNIIGHYDTIKPPKELFAYHPVSSSTVDAPPQVSLAANKKIGFAYADRSVVIGETMTYVVTYKPDSLVNTIVGFFYNDNNSFNRQNVFNEITSTDQTYPFVVTNGSSITTENIKVVRIKEETTTISVTVPPGIPQRVADSLTTAKGSFNNAIYFIIPPAINKNERNAFISMAAPVNSNLIGYAANIKAILINFNKTPGYISQDTVTDVLPVGQFASDPNGIITTPHCLDSFHGGPFNQPINYDITFVNTGNGAAKNIDVTVWVPEGIQLNPAQMLNVTSTVSRKKISFYKGSGPKGLNINTYKIITTPIGKGIVFSMKGINLPGVNSSTIARKDIQLRRGSISFTLNTIADPHNQQTATDKLSCMYSDVSIVFTSVLKSGEETTNTPITGWDLIRENCNFASPLPPPCPRKLLVVVPPPTR
jgi:uncharacterized repeat protein (TIGR01451 family)